MRVLKKNLRGDDGEISLLAESLDDLWHLKYLIEPGDLVFALTQRKASSVTDKIRPEKMERRTLRLGVRVETIEFHIYSNWLRLHGIIKSGADVGAYHTLNIEVGSDLSIIKRWRPDEFQRIKEAVSASSKPRLVLALIEEGEATIGLLRQFGVQTVAEIRKGSGKGAGEDRRGQFLSEVAKEIERAAGDDAQVIIAGPGFAKEDLHKRINADCPGLIGRITMDEATSIGSSGFQEVLRRGAVETILESSRLALESRLMEDLLREISRDGKATYGPAQVRTALDYGAVETLMVVDELARTPAMDPLIRHVMAGRGKVVVFSSEFEPGKRLEALGGVAALLRFQMGR